MSETTCEHKTGPPSPTNPPPPPPSPPPKSRRGPSRGGLPMLGENTRTTKSGRLQRTTALHTRMGEEERQDGRNGDDSPRDRVEGRSRKFVDYIHVSARLQQARNGAGRSCSDHVRQCWGRYGGEEELLPSREMKSEFRLRPADRKEWRPASPSYQLSERRGAVHEEYRKGVHRASSVKGGHRNPVRR